MLFAMCTLLAAARLDPGHYFFSGPLTNFMVEGSTAGASTSGLPFTVVLSDGGSKVAGDFDLKGPGWDNPIHAHLANAKFEGGHLKGSFQFKNESGKVLEGLRLDCTGATEDYTDGGQTKSR